MARTLPNDNFIDFLAVYGPWNNGVIKYDEYVAKAAARYNVKPFEFKLPRQQQYLEALTELVRNSTSQVILINGNAGDGKTHFLQKLLFKLGIFASPEAQEQAIAAAQDDRLLFVQQPAINFTIVKDLSDTDKSPELITKLFLHVNNVLLASSNHEHASFFLPKPHIVIIAGNNGKILQCFKLHLDPTLNQVIELLEQQMLSSGRTKSLATTMANMATPRTETAAGNAVPYDLSSWHISLLDMASCLNDEAVQEVWHTIIENEMWNQCSGCAFFKYCPICRNREALAAPLVLQRFLDIYTLIHDEGEHLTMRSLLLLLSNALLGKYQSSRADGFFTCRKVRNLANKMAKAATATTTAKTKTASAADAQPLPLPFDNLMGLNLSTRYQEKSDLPVFKQLSLFGLGEHSLQAIDTFLLQGLDNAELGWSGAYKKLFSTPAAIDLITRLRTTISELKRTQDNTDDAISGIISNTDNALVQAQAKVQRTLAALRRLSFFTLEQDAHGKEIFNPFTLSAFAFGRQYLGLKNHLLAAEKSDQILRSGNANYSSYNANITNNSVFTDVHKIKQSLIVGLNRAFTHLMVVKDQDEIFVSNNNKLNPTAFCVIYGVGMKLGVDFNTSYSNSNSTKLTFGLSGNSTQSPSERLMVIRYSAPPVTYPHADQTAHAAANQASLSAVELTLTPKMFEYLMALASGKMAISFSQECHEDLNAFKDNLTARLTSNAGDYKQRPNEPLAMSLNRIEICDIDLNGSIINNNSAY